MRTAQSIELNKLTDCYVEWLKGEEKEKAVDCKIKGVALQVIFKRGYRIYPLKDAPRGSFRPHSINFIGTDLKIHLLAQGFSMPKDGAESEIQPLNEKLGRSGVQVRVFKDVEAYQQAAQAQEEEDSEILKPDWTSIDLLINAAEAVYEFTQKILPPHFK
ncbi:MAG: hypothetical protein K0S07_340 [Chlamydiales bacterium]|jgi:hypothetical protein|nr:hypothetical protein [Chlamydiales bacterium]